MGCSGCNKAGRIAKGIGYLAAGVNDVLSKERMKVCRNCNYFVGGISCQICSCFVAAKTRVESEECPEKKWLKVTS